MATIVDKLFVTFGLDPSEFISGQKQLDASQKKNRSTSETTRKQMEEDGKRTVAAFRSIRNEVLALVASFVGLSAIKQFTTEITHSDASLGRMAQTLGMSVPELWVWEKAMEQFGVTAKETDGALSSLTDLAQSWKYGAPITAEMSRGLAQAGVDVVKFHDAATTLPERIDMLATAFKKIGPAAAEVLGSSLGLGRQFVAELAIHGPEGLAKMKAAMQALGPVTEAQALAAIKREQEWNNMQTRIQEFERYLVITFWPLVEPIIKGMMDWWQQNQVEIVTDLKAAVVWLGAELKKVPWHAIGEDIKWIAKHADEAAQSFGGWGKSMEYLLGAYLALKGAGAILGIMALLRGAGIIGGGAALAGGVGAGGAATAGGVGAAGAAVLGLGGILSALLLGLFPKGTDVIDEHGKGEDERMEDYRKLHNVKGYGKDVYGPPTSMMNKTSTSQANYNITLYATSATGNAIVSALDTYFHNLSIAAPAQQGGR